MMKKRLLSFLLAASIGMSAITASAALNRDEDVLSLLSELNIMSGDPDGNMRLDDYVSRAEFTKVAVASSDYKNSIAAGMAVSPFKDVPYTHWAAPYVKAAVSAGICEGYVDSTFRPDGTVTFEEAVTMLLRVLGYTDEDFGISWPYGQVGMAQNLEITEGVDAGIGDLLTRRDVARLVYNTLDTKKKDSTQKQISIFDCQVIEGATIIASNAQDSSLGADKIYTSAGILKCKNAIDQDDIGRRGDLIIKNDDDFVSFQADDQQVDTYEITNVIGSDLILDNTVLGINENTTVYYKSQTLTYKTAVAQAQKGDSLKVFSTPGGSIDYAVLLPRRSGAVTEDLLEKYVIYSQLSDAVIGYKDGTFTQIDIQDSTDCYKDNVQTTYGALKSSMEMGDILYVKRDGNTIDYVSYEKGNMQGPVKIGSSGVSGAFSINSSTSFMRDGNKVSSDEIVANDIAYYSADLNMVLAYTTKVTGVYENASPTKDAPSSVVISGKEYTVEGVDAFNALSSSGSFKFGDTITVLLGKTGGIAGVITADEAQNTSVTGYVTSAGTKEFTNADGTTYNNTYATIVTADGIEHEYTTTWDSSNYKGSVCKATFKDGKATLTRISTTNSSVRGKVNASQNTIGNDTLADNVKILDVASAIKGDNISYVTVFPQRLDGITISSDSVLYYTRNGADEISELILTDVTGDAYRYGIVTSSNVTEMSASYTVDINGEERTYQTNYTSKASGPYRFALDDSGIAYMSKLPSYSGSVSELTATYAVCGGVKYLLSDKAVAYQYKTGSGYYKIPIEDLIENPDDYTVHAYYDKAESAGGRIRILVANQKIN